MKLLKNEFIIGVGIGIVSYMVLRRRSKNMNEDTAVETLIGDGGETITMEASETAWLESDTTVNLGDMQ